MAQSYHGSLADITQQHIYQNLHQNIQNSQMQMAQLQQSYANQAQQATLAQVQYLQGRANDGRQFLMAVQQGAPSQAVQAAQNKLWQEIQHYEAKAREAAAEEAYRAYSGDYPKIEEEKPKQKGYTPWWSVFIYPDKASYWYIKREQLNAFITTPLRLIDWAAGLL
jgi:hypothetical protein